MRTITLILTTCFLSIAVNAQSGALKLIEQYSGKEGYTTVTISKSLFRMLSKSEKESEDYEKVRSFSNKLNDFKILVAQDTKDKVFKTKLSNLAKSLDTKGYEELLSVQEGKNSIVKISILENKDKIKELVLSVIDDSDAVLMVIGGDFTLDEILEISDDVEIDALNELEKAKRKT